MQWRDDCHQARWCGDLKRPHQTPSDGALPKAPVQIFYPWTKDQGKHTDPAPSQSHWSDIDYVRGAEVSRPSICCRWYQLAAWQAKLLASAATHVGDLFLSWAQGWPFGQLPRRWSAASQSALAAYKRGVALSPTRTSNGTKVLSKMPRHQVWVMKCLFLWHAWLCMLLWSTHLARTCLSCSLVALYLECY